jgi:hypothetical protein
MISLSYQRLLTDFSVYSDLKLAPCIERSFLRHLCSIWGLIESLSLVMIYFTILIEGSIHLHSALFFTKKCEMEQFDNQTVLPSLSKFNKKVLKLIHWQQHSILNANLY